MTLTDPRTLRTRGALIDAFNTLLRTKEFEQISIKEITALAHVNRATFYAHFVDKYALLDEVLKETITTILNTHIESYTSMQKETIEQMFLTIVHLHDQMHGGCRRGYNTLSSYIENTTKEQLAERTRQLDDTISLSKAAMFSWALYGAYKQWTTQHVQSAESCAKETAASLYPFVVAI